MLRKGWRCVDKTIGNQRAAAERRCPTGTKEGSTELSSASSVPLLPSQARTVSDTVPAKALLGTKRIKSLPDNSKAVPLLAAPTVVGKGVQFAPPFVENCQVPSADPV